jgi:glycosyltransferase involved in cell wall biosynthesis
MTPEITVVMATYRQEKWLAQAVMSVRNQGIDHILRVVSVIGDMETHEVLSPIFNKQNDGCILWSAVPQANLWRQRQLGIEWSFTPYITFFDSDDMMSPGWLKEALRVAKAISERGKIPIVGPSYRMIDEDYHQIQDVILPEFSMDKMMNGSIIPDFSITTTEAMRSVGGYFDPDGYDPGHPMYSYALWLRMLKTYKDKIEVKLLPEIGFLYRQHRQNMHHKFNSKRTSAENVRRAREVARHYFPNWGMGMKSDGKTP